MTKQPDLPLALAQAGYRAVTVDDIRNARNAELARAARRNDLVSLDDAPHVIVPRHMVKRGVRVTLVRAATPRTI